MKTFKQYLKEINLSRIQGTLEKGAPVGTVSPERGQMTKKQKKTAHKAIQKDLRRLSDQGMISFSGPHKGRYMYDKDAAPSKEGSYVLRPGNHPKAKNSFHRILKMIGKRYGQESVMKLKGRKGALHFTTGPREGKVDKLGSLKYNRPLETGRGDTQLKGKGASFTVNE